MYHDRGHDIEVSTGTLSAANFVGRLLNPNNNLRSSMLELLNDRWLELESQTLADGKVDEDSEYFENAFDEIRDLSKQKDREKKQQVNKKQDEFDNKQYWNALQWNHQAVCGSIAYHTNCSKIWRKVLDRFNVFDIDSKNKHMLDLCSGWGRLIFNVALTGRYKFKSYTGVDISI